MDPTPTIDLRGLLTAAAEDGEVRPSTTALLTDAKTLMQISRGSGISADAFLQSEALFVTLLIDDSRSIEDGGNSEAVCQGHNGILDALLGASASRRARTIVSTRLLNGGVVSPYVMLEQAVRLENGKNYVADGITPFFDQAMVTEGSVLAKVQEFEQAGITVRTWTGWFTDGCDYGSKNAKASDVAQLVGTLNGEQHQHFAMGVSDGRTDFNAVFRSMGVHPDKIRTSTNDPKSIRAMMREASQSATAMNQPSAAGGGLGGFGA